MQVCLHVTQVYNLHISLTIASSPELRKYVGRDVIASPTRASTRICRSLRHRLFAKALSNHRILIVGTEERQPQTLPFLLGEGVGGRGRLFGHFPLDFKTLGKAPLALKNEILQQLRVAGVGKKRVVVLWRHRLERGQFVPRHGRKVVMFDVVADGEREAVGDAVIRICSLEGMSWIVLLNPAGTQRMQADAADASEHQEQDGAPPGKRVNESTGGDIGNPVQGYPRDFISFRNTVRIEGGAQSLNNEEESQPDGLAKRGIANEACLPFKRDVRVLVGPVELDVVQDVIVAEHHC